MSAPNPKGDKWPPSGSTDRSPPTTAHSRCVADAIRPDFFAIVLCLLASFLRMRPRAAQVLFGVALVLGKGRLHQRRGSLKASRLLNMNHHQLFT